MRPAFPSAPARARSRFARPRHHRVSAVIAGAAALVCSRHADADLANFTFNATDNATIQPAGPRTGANGKNFFNVEADGNGTNASYGVIDFGQINVGNNHVNSLNSISLDLFDSPSAFSSTNNVVVDFYLVTATNDAAVNIQPTTSPLKYVSGKTPQGGFGTSLTSAVLLGSGNYASSGNGFHFGYTNLSTAGLNAAANAYVLNQLNTFGSLRLVATLEPASGTGAAATYAGFSSNAAPLDPTFTSAAPKLNLGLDVTALPNNDSVLTFRSATDAAHVGFDLGRVIRNAASGTVAVTVGNAGTAAANALLNNSNTLSSVTAGSLPLAGGATTRVTVGLSAAATAGPAGIAQAAGTLLVHNVSNANSSDLQVDLTGAIVESRIARNVELATGSSVTNLGKILVGTTVTNRITVSTQNNTGGFGTDYLTATSISATATASFAASSTSPYNMSGTNVGGAVSWNGTGPTGGTQTATFVVAVTPTKSFTSGAGTAAAFLRFTNTNGISGEGLANEADQINLYSQFTAYAPAVLTGSTNLTSATTGAINLSNAAGDNGTASLSLRLGGRITASSIVAQGGFSFSGTSTLAAGNVIAGATTNAATYSFDKTGKLNGLYKGTYTYSAENDDQTVTGTRAGDVATNKAVAFVATVSGNSGSGTANILPGGSYAGYSINSGTAANTTVAFIGGTSAGGANPTVNFATSTSTRAMGDVGIITGTGTDAYVVQYNYGTSVAGNAISVGRFTGAGYTHAAYGNSNAALGTEVVGAYNATATASLGTYGIDTTNHVVWAVVDRPGSFTPYARAAGDANFDGKVDFTDVQLLLGSGKYNAGTSGGAASFAQGDFSGDAKVDFTDVQTMLGSGLYNKGAYDPTLAAAPAKSLAAAPKLSSTGSDGQIAAATTGGTAGDGKFTVVYDANTGDIKVESDGLHLTSIKIASAGGFFTHPPTFSNHPVPQNTANFDGDLSTRNANETDYAVFGTGVYFQDYDYGNLMDANHTLAQLLSDLTVTYNVDGQTGILNGDVRVVGTPEPATLSLLGLGAIGLLARRRRRRSRPA